MSKKNYDYLVKILLIGDSGVGKTTICHSYFDKVFINNHLQTIGVDFRNKTIELDNKIVKLQVWDTAGQERFDSITQSFYRGAHGIAMVFDVTDPKSFLNIKKWLNNIQENADEKVLKLLIGNKIDMVDIRVINKESAKEIADNFDMIYSELSAKTCENLNETIDTFTRKIVEELQNKKNNSINLSQNTTLSQENINTNSGCVC